jgi:WD40 repeat protein/DNA-binding SARP family transcriptional activator
MLELRLLGQFEIRVDGGVVQLASRPAQSLLAYLALSAGTAHRREKLAGLLWPEAEEDNARSNLRHALWRIRKAIETGEATPPYLLSDELAVAFNAGANYWLDAALLARDADGRETLQELQESLAAYRGELLPGFYDDWVSLERGRLEAAYQHRMQRLLDRLVDERRWPEVLEWAERWVALGHAPEPGYRALMLAHDALGDRPRVAEAYRRCREALFNELAVEPSAQTRRLYERLSRGEPPPPAPGASAPPPERTDDEAPAPGQPPFQGLRYFDEGDADRFFGRERLTAALVGRLRAEPFLAVIGASGSGKSSVVRAGLVPALSGAAAPAGDGSSPDVHLFTPTGHPLDALAAALHGGRAPAAVVAALLDELGRDPDGLRRHLGWRLQRGRRALLVVDQLEELFTLCHDAFEREAFVENLLAAADADGPARVVVALRADFYAHCAQYPGLREAMAQHQEYVGPMGAGELRRAIEAPAERGGWSFEPGLVELILRDVGEEPGSLPLLSHALLETWRLRRGRRLTLEGYTAAGGVQGAIARTAEAVLHERLAPRQRALARRVFLRLTELGEGTQDTRRRASTAELVVCPEEEPELRAVLHTLAEARLVTLGAGTAEVAHEALIREWPTLREWLRHDREGLRLHRQLADAAREWERLGRDPGGLYRGARLAQALEWAAEQQQDLNALERAFLDTSRATADQEAAEREALRQRELEAARRVAEAERARAEAQVRAAGQLRQRALYLTAAFVLALAMAGVALFFGDQARRNAALAQATARTAFSRELAAAALANLDADPERSILLGLQAVSATYDVDGTATNEAEDALHRAVLASRALLTLAGHTAEVWSVVYSPDGGRLATASQDKTAKVWDSRTGRELLTLTGHADSVNGLAYSPDGGRLVTTSDDHTARVWDAATGDLRFALSGHTGPVYRVAFSPDGTRLATASADRTARLWDAATGRELLTLSPHPGDVFSAAFSPDGRRLAAGTRGKVVVWDLSTATPLLSLPISDAGGARSVAFSPDGRLLAAADGNDGVATVWDASTGAVVLRLAGHTNLVGVIAFSPDGRLLATGSLDRKVKVWDAAAGRELLTLAGHRSAINGLSFSPDGKQLASSAWDGTARVWDLGPARELLTLPGVPASAGRIAFAADGQRLMTGLPDGTARVWDASSGREALTLRGSRAALVQGVAASPDGSRLATASADGLVKVWDAGSGRELLSIAAHAGDVLGLAFAPDGTRLASAGGDGTAKVWNLTGRGRDPVVLSGHADAVNAVAFSPDGRRVLTGSTDRTARVWDAASGQPLHQLSGHADIVWGVAYSPDGGRIATASRDGSAKVWEAATGSPLLTMRGHTGTVVSVAFSPDGRRLATASRDGTARLWDVATGREVLSLYGDGTGLMSVAFSPDGKRLATGGNSVRLYALPIEELTDLARGRLTRWWTAEECQKFLRQEQCPPRPQPNPHL